MRRVLRAIAVGATAIALLAGCVAIPTSGGVRTEALDTDPDEVPNVVLPDGPSTGQSPTELLQGFIRAGRAPQNNYQIARMYLTSSAAWSGIERVLVTTSQITPVQVDEDTVEVTVTVVGEVDARGVYTVREPRAQTLTYDLETVDGEYRIARADVGTVLSRNGFDTAFRPYPLSFYDVTFGSMVADLRWFPESRAVATRIVRELLIGPSPWLAAPIALSAFPAGTEADTTTEAPRVGVDLSSTVRAESPVAQRRMIFQIEQSLAALGNVTDIDITAGGLALTPAPAEDPGPLVRYQVLEGVVGGMSGAVGTLGPEGVRPLSEIGTRADSLQPTAASLARDRRSLAVLGTGGVSLVEITGSPILVDARPGLIAPSLDRYGYAWTVPAGDPAGLRATGSDVVAHPMPLPVDGEVVSIDVSRDGTRLLVGLAAATGSRAVVLGVQRDADGIPVGFGSPLTLPVTESVVDAAWVDQTSVAVLLTGATGTHVDVYPLGGPMRALGAVPDAVQIVGGNEVTGLRVLTADGTIRRPVNAGGWIELEVSASFLATQQ
jgi:hypothetical protein